MSTPKNSLRTGMVKVMYIDVIGLDGQRSVQKPVVISGKLVTYKTHGETRIHVAERAGGVYREIDLKGVSTHGVQQ